MELWYGLLKLGTGTAFNQINYLLYSQSSTVLLRTSTHLLTILLSTTDLLRRSTSESIFDLLSERVCCPMVVTAPQIYLYN